MTTVNGANRSGVVIIYRFAFSSLLRCLFLYACGHDGYRIDSLLQGLARESWAIGFRSIIDAS